MTAEQPRKPELHMSPIKQGFAFNAEGGGGIACGITDLGNGKRLLTVKHVQVPDELMNQGRGGQLYNRAVQEGIARGAGRCRCSARQIGEFSHVANADVSGGRSGTVEALPAGRLGEGEHRHN